MDNDKRIAELLVETKAFTSLKQPVILTSGEIAIYYINTEKLVQDGGEFDKYKDDSQAMIRHAVRMTQEHPTYREVIDMLAESVSEKFLKALFNGKNRCAVSGGQRRDWLFSGPVAHKLEVPHISLYKATEENPRGKIEVINPNGALDTSPLFIRIGGTYDVHIVDLITEGSSVLTIKEGKEQGWLPMIRNSGATIDYLEAVVSRLQGGEEMLAWQGVNVKSRVAIGEPFLRKLSPNAERDIDYQKDARNWSERYLRENGALVFIESFDPNGGKVKRAGNFFKRYEPFLEECGRLKELEEGVQKEYGKPIKEIIGDKK